MTVVDTIQKIIKVISISLCISILAISRKRTIGRAYLKAILSEILVHSSFIIPTLIKNLPTRITRKTGRVEFRAKIKLDKVNISFTY